MGRRSNHHLAILFAAALLGDGLSADPAQAEEGEGGGAPGLPQITLAMNDSSSDIALGYRQDNLKWTIAGNAAGNGPNILSELDWTNLEIQQVEARTRLTFTNDLYLRGGLSLGRIVKGQNRDSDYDGADHAQEWSRSENSAKDGQVWDASLGFGYVILRDKGFLGDSRLMPLVGYSYHEQDLRIRDGKQTVSGVSTRDGSVAPALGPIAGLDSSYTAQWRGPWMGLDYASHLPEKWDLFASYEFHWAAYEGDANWNLRTDLAHPVSFHQSADATGHLLEVGLARELEGKWSLNAVGRVQDWSTLEGVHRQNNANGTFVESRFNGAEWDSYTLMLGASYRY
ncbi:MAG: hypothetical protein HQL51_09940 [Magnetococcales bacterium]|nr:hypothetical protein [Magnetococcales bacterium]